MLAATNPDPEVFAYAAAQVKKAMDATHRLGGANYVLWGGREGYDTLLNTDLRREAQQLARFLAMVVEHKHKTGFRGTLLIEPKPMEPTKHQYDFDAAAVHAFLCRFGLEKDIKLNIEVNHATLAGHSFASKLQPPVEKPPARRITYSASVASSALFGNWSVSQPFCGSPRFTSTLPSRSFAAA